MPNLPNNPTPAQREAYNAYFAEYRRLNRLAIRKRHRDYMAGYRARLKRTAEPGRDSI